jgi:hypothetical protein
MQIVSVVEPRFEFPGIRGILRGFLEIDYSVEGTEVRTIDSLPAGLLRLSR